MSKKMQKAWHLGVFVLLFLVAVASSLQVYGISVFAAPIVLLNVRSIAFLPGRLEAPNCTKRVPLKLCNVVATCLLLKSGLV